MPDLTEVFERNKDKEEIEIKRQLEFLEGTRLKKELEKPYRCAEAGYDAGSGPYECPHC